LPYARQARRKRQIKGAALAGCPGASRRKEEEEDPTGAATQQLYHAFLLVAWNPRDGGVLVSCNIEHLVGATQPARALPARVGRRLAARGAGPRTAPRWPRVRQI